MTAAQEPQQKSAKENSKRFSFEFFPPKTPKGEENLRKVHAELSKKKPDFFSVTYGAGGSTRDGTLNTVLEMNDKGICTAPHLSFGNDNEETILELINQYKTAGVTRIVALRGDTPAQSDTAQQSVGANQLVQFIREKTGDHFQLEVAAYPEIHPKSESYETDLQFLKSKFDAGANSAITQYFYNPDAYFYYLDRCQKLGIEQPIYPGIMPIINFTNLARFSKACGAEIPRWISKQLEAYGDDLQSVQSFGLEVVSQLCYDLLKGGAPGLHFYTMNKAEPTTLLWDDLQLSEM